MAKVEEREKETSSSGRRVGQPNTKQQTLNSEDGNKTGTSLAGQEGPPLCFSCKNGSCLNRQEVRLLASSILRLSSGRMMQQRAPKSDGMTANHEFRGRQPDRQKSRPRKEGHLPFCVFHQRDTVEANCPFVHIGNDDWPPCPTRQQTSDEKNSDMIAKSKAGGHSLQVTQNWREPPCKGEREP